MIQNYLDLKIKLSELNQITLSGGQIQKVYSTSFFITLSIRRGGKTTVIYLGRGQGVEGIWWDDKIPPSSHRCKDQFLEYLRRHITNTGFHGFHLDKKDRILILEYHKYAAINKFGFFWKGRQLYFSHLYYHHEKENYYLFKSWDNQTISVDEKFDLYSSFDDVGRIEVQQICPSEDNRDLQSILKEEWVDTKTEMNKKLKFLLKKKEKIESDLEKTKLGYKLKESITILDVTSMAGKTKIYGVDFDFPSGFNDFEKRNLIFDKIKKLKKGEIILTSRLIEVDDKIKQITEHSEIKSQHRIPVKPVWGTIKPPTQDKKNQSHQEFLVFKIDELQIAVGQSAKGNDQIRNSWAAKEDYWLHLDGKESAHVVVKKNNQLVLTQDEINIASTILAVQSKFYDVSIPILFTQVKNLKGVSGKPGMVIYKKEKRLTVRRIDLELLGVKFS